MRAVICCLVVVGLLLPTFAECAREKPVAVQAGEGEGGQSVRTEKEELGPIVAYAIWKFVEGVGWIIIGWGLKKMWEYVWEKDTPELMDSPPEFEECPADGTSGVYT